MCLGGDFGRGRNPCALGSRACIAGITVGGRGGEFAPSVEDFLREAWCTVERDNGCDGVITTLPNEEDVGRNDTAGPVPGLAVHGDDRLLDPDADAEAAPLDVTTL